MTKRKPRVTIREMDIDDIPAVFHLGEQLFTSEEYPILYRTWDAYEVTGTFTEDPDYCFVAEVYGMVVGFILGTTIEKEGTAWKKYGYVSWIGVDENYQRMHLGKRLYRKLEGRLKTDGARMLIADTEEDNDEALAFFNAMGYSLYGRHVWVSKTLRRRTKPSSYRKKTTNNHV
jgi:ribosomal protein S18 acetylase RimI-like enzyme